MNNFCAVIRRLFALWLLSCCLIGTANAATARYDYAGTTAFCDDAALGGGICGVLLDVGDLIGGFAILEADDLGNAVLDASNVVHYQVGLDGVGADPSVSELDPLTMVITDGDGMVVDGFVSILIDPTLLPAAINLDLAAGTWEILVFPGILDLLLAGGDGAFGAPQAVPLPAGLWLLGSALLGLAARRKIQNRA